MHRLSLEVVHLASEEDTGASTNLGTITFDGVSYSLPDDISKTVGTYSAEYFADANYLFDHWETTRLVSVSDANANPVTVTVSGGGTLKPIYAAHHSDHLNDEYAPMVIPFRGKTLTVAPVITCTVLEDGVFKPFHYPCKSARTTFVDNDWSDSDANYMYVFEDWIDYDWNDILVSLHAVTNDIIEVGIRLEDREACWKNPFSVEITPESLIVDVHWNSTDYPEEHVFRVNPNDTGGIELFAESNPGDTASMTIIPIIPPVASFVYSPLYPKVCENVTFNASTSTPNGGYIVSYEWDFGDDSPREFGIVVTHHYTTTGTYTATLNVTDREGIWDTESKMMTVTPRTYTVTITSTSGGTTYPVPGSYLYNEGTVVPVIAVSDSGYVFDHWTLDGSPAGSTNPINVLIDCDHELEAVFTQITYTLTITTTTGGTTSPSPGAHVYSSGTDIPVTATAQNGHHFDHWVLDGLNAGSDNLISVTMDKDHTLHSVFEEVRPPPVGGHALPIDKHHFLTLKINLIPGIGLAFVLLAAMAVTTILIRRRNKSSR
jgi:PKD repeat protein